MRILHINKAYSATGGVEKYLRDICDIRIPGVDQVDVLAMSEGFLGKNVPNRHGKVIECGRFLNFASAPLSVTFPIQFLRLCWRYDVLHFHYPNPMGELLMILFGRFLREKRIVVTYHNDVSDKKPFSRAYNRLAALFFKLCDVIVVTSPNLGHSASVLNDFQDKVEVIPLGINLPTEAGRLVDLESPRASRALRLLFVGRLAPVKGIDVLISAAAGLDVELIIIGEGKLRLELDALAGRLGVNAKFMGSVSDKQLQRAYEEADIFVLPSVTRGEGFGYVILEAMSHGCAIISTELGTGTSYVNQDGVTGVVVEPGNVQALSRAITSLQTDRARLATFSSAAQQRALEFTFDKMSQRLRTMYRASIQSSTGIS